MVDTLRQAGFVSDLLPPERCVWKFEVRSAAGNERFMLTPLKGMYFNLDKAEVRKQGIFLRSERSVVSERIDIFPYTADHLLGFFGGLCLKKITPSLVS